MNERRKVMIVDDDRTNIAVLRQILEPGYTVQIAKNGHLAIALATRSKPDLVLLDILMPELDGYAVCETLKTQTDTMHIPVIFITSRCNVKDEAKGLALGAVDYITKPFNPSIIKARVQTHIELKAHRELLESRVQQSAYALSETNKALEKKSLDLYKTDIALNVILDKKERIEQSIQEKLACNMELSITPHLDTLETATDQEVKRKAIDNIKAALHSLRKNDAGDLQSVRHKLSPTEIKIADWIREGKSTKEISKLSKLVEKTVYWHRKNIREKLGLQNQKQSLRSHLIALDNH